MRKVVLCHIGAVNPPHLDTYLAIHDHFASLCGNDSDNDDITSLANKKVQHFEGYNVISNNDQYLTLLLNKCKFCCLTKLKYIRIKTEY